MSGAKFHLPERLTVSNTGKLLVAACRAMDNGLQELDLGVLKRVDSSAVTLLLGMQRHARQHSLPLRFTRLPANLQSLITLYGVEELLPLQP
ncbi:MAG: STAS domain-containing protein [Burkholderiaceae bacterium]|nr:MAG: STAS domain-containing protein [Burkholderiaceae bacterium]